MMGHQQYAEVISSFKDINTFKYAAYRLALKVRRLQKACKLHLLDVTMICNTRVDKDLHSNNSFMTISTKDAETYLLNLYEIIQHQLGYAAEPEILAQIFLSFMSNVFSVHSETLHLYQLKIVLFMLCGSKLSDKQKYIFRQLGPEGRLNVKNLFLLLECLTGIGDALGEKVTFGSSLLSATIKNCLTFCASSDNILESQFFDWLAHEPQTLVWISTHYRLSISEKVEHSVKCNVCKSQPIIGLRYKCLCCFGYNLCQECFLRAFVNKGHDLKHYVQEYCQPTTCWEETKTTMRIIRNKIVSRSRLKQNFLEFDNFSSFSSVPKDCDELFIQSSTWKKNSAMKELSSILEKLEEENMQLNMLAKEIDINSEKYCAQLLPFIGGENSDEWILVKRKALQEHSDCMQLQLERLNQLLKSTHMDMSNTSVVKDVIPFQTPPLKLLDMDVYFESTPLAAANRNSALPVPQNLSKFIKLHTEMDRLKNLFRTADSHDVQDTLYSVADIELGDCTNVTFDANFALSTLSSIKKNIDDCSSLSNMLIPSINNSLTSNNPDTNPWSILYDSLPPVTSTKISLLNGILYSPRFKHLNFESLSTKEILANLSTVEESSIEVLRGELNKIDEHLEAVYPKITDFQDDLPLQKQTFIKALLEIEEALQKLSSSISNNQKAKNLMK